jgi:hypothetical protein
MFKVKTDFGFILVEKSKIASIIPTASDTGKGSASAETGNGSTSPASAKGDVRPAARTQTRPESTPPEAPTLKAEAGKEQFTAEPAVETTIEKPAPRIATGPVRPELPASPRKTAAVAPTLKAVPDAAASALASSVTPLAPAKDATAPVIPQEVQGNVYVNHTYGFRMYKAPSWQLIEDPTALPNAIVAMGTPNESTLMVVGREKTKQSLDAAANTVEGRLHDVYEGYQQVSHRKTTVGGAPAVEYRYRGKAEDHDWSGTLVVIARGNDIFTALGMTYADSDLIQIQENVIAKAIASLDFSAR